jgi:hypothetical protein
LIKAAPQSVNEEDDYGIDPLEYAINSNASINKEEAANCN